MSEYIVGIETYNSGGGNMLDFITLENGKVLCINDEYIGLYNSIEDVFGDKDLCINGFYLQGDVCKLRT